MKPTYVLLLVAVALCGATGAVTATDGQHVATVDAREVVAVDGQHVAAMDDRHVAASQQQPTWPGDDIGSDDSGDDTGLADDDTDPADDETTTNATDDGDDTTGVSPGQQLAGAVGAQGASLQGELWNRTLSGRLENATTPAQRAEVVTDEVETLESYLTALEAVRGNLTEAWADGELSEGQYRTSLAEFVVRARTVERRANQTARAAEDLPESTREVHGVNATHIWNLGEQAHDLYQFEGEIGQEVANETLANQSLGRFAVEDEESDEDE